MAATLSDETLIQQALQGRQSAYAMLVKRYEQYVFTLALRFVKNREDAHEVAQDSFMRAFRYLPDFRGDAKFTTWMYKIVFSTSLNHLRKNNPDILSLDDDEKPIKLKDPGTPDASYGMELGDRSASLQRAIGMLSPDDAGVCLDYAETTTITLRDPVLARLETLAARDDLPERGRIQVQFALGKAYADLKDDRRSFQHLMQGNALKRATTAYDEAESARFFDRIKTVFTPELTAEK